MQCRRMLLNFEEGDFRMASIGANIKARRRAAHPGAEEAVSARGPAGVSPEARPLNGINVNCISNYLVVTMLLYRGVTGGHS